MPHVHFDPLKYKATDCAKGNAYPEHPGFFISPMSSNRRAKDVSPRLLRPAPGGSQEAAPRRLDRIDTIHQLPLTQWGSPVVRSSHRISQDGPRRKVPDMQPFCLSSWSDFHPGTDGN